jgi:hypothetical protein
MIVNVDALFESTNNSSIHETPLDDTNLLDFFTNDSGDFQLFNN